MIRIAPYNSSVKIQVQSEFIHSLNSSWKNNSKGILYDFLSSTIACRAQRIHMHKLQIMYIYRMTKKLSHYQVSPLNRIKTVIKAKFFISCDYKMSIRI